MFFFEEQNTKKQNTKYFTSLFDILININIWLEVCLK